MKRCENTGRQVGSVPANAAFVPLLLAAVLLALLAAILAPAVVRRSGVPAAAGAGRWPAGGTGPTDRSLSQPRQVVPPAPLAIVPDALPAGAERGGGGPDRAVPAPGASGGPRGSEAAAAGNRPGGDDRHEGPDSRLLVQWLYRNFLGESGDPEAIALWASLIDAGTIAPEQAVESFLDSARQYRGVAPVTRLYLAAFLRPPDFAGLAHWRDAVFTGAELEEVGARIAGSEEFAARYGALDGEAFIDQAFRNAFGREPTDTERAHWRARVGPDAVSRGRMMVALSESADFRASVRGEVDTVMLYAGLLGRAPDGPGFAAWAAFLADGNSRHALIRGFLASREFRARLVAGAPTAGR